MTATEPPADLITPDPSTATPQEPTKRHRWSKPKVQTKPTAADRREFRAADKQAPRS